MPFWEQLKGKHRRRPSDFFYFLTVQYKGVIITSAYLHIN